jgi:hypothetical protein
MPALAVGSVLVDRRDPVDFRHSPLDASREVVMDERGALAHAIADMAEQVGARPGDVMVVTLEKVTWPDEAMGCPRPGQTYPQVRVQGYRIVLRAKGEEAVYHGASGRLPFRCDQAE